MPVFCFIYCCVFVLGALPFSAVAGTAPQAVIEQVTTISPDEGRYFNGWPTIARRSDGGLLVVWSGGRESHACPFGRVESMISGDDGRTWSWPRVLFDSAIDDRDAGILVTSHGTVLVTTFTSTAYLTSKNRPKDSELPEKWRRFERSVHSPPKVGPPGAYLLRSDDGGLSWSAAQRIPVSSPHGPVQLADGRLLYPGVQRAGAGPVGDAGRKVGVWESRDDGRRWIFLSSIPARRHDNIAEYHELHGAESKDGTIVVLIRSHADQANRQMLQTESRDGGKTWSEPRALNLFGYPPHLRRLRDGRLLLSYDHRRPAYGVQARISDDQGATWSEPVLVTENATKLDQGYPSTVELGDGTLLTVWYEAPAGGGKAVLKQARWRLAPPS